LIVTDISVRLDGASAAICSAMLAWVLFSIAPQPFCDPEAQAGPDQYRE
jgi:hypothetical protein